MAKRKKGTPVEEIEEAAKRMKKRPEHLKAAKNNTTWLNFLQNIGVSTTDTKQGQAFWEHVRKEIKPTSWTEPYVNPKTKQTSYRDSKGKFVSPESIGAPRQVKISLPKPTPRQVAEANAYEYVNPKTGQTSYRNNETGKFTKIQ